MARPTRGAPIPKAYKRGNSFRIRWYARNQMYEFSLGEVSRDFAQAIAVSLAAAFAKRGPFPEEILSEPVINRFLAAEAGVAGPLDDTTLIEAYFRHQKINLTSLWPVRVKYFLEKAYKHMGVLQSATTNQIVEFLDTLADSISPQSRNRAQTAMSGFYKWMRLSGHVNKFHNPMLGIKQVRETPKADGIVIWEQTELRQLLKAADTLRDGIAVWIAIFAGLRRGEIANVEWSHIHEAYISVVKSKTGEPRQVPLSTRLAKRLTREKKGRGKVVPWPDAFYGWETAATRLVKEYLQAKLPKIAEKHPEKFGWNAFRHTFASRHAQNGLSLDIIAAWMGDSPKVCKKHYARYVPQNKRDKRIDAADKI